MSCKLEPVIWTCNTGQKTLFCQVSISHLQVRSSLYFKASLSVKSLKWKWVFTHMESRTAITITKLSQLDSLWNTCRGSSELGNGLLTITFMCNIKKWCCKPRLYVSFNLLAGAWPPSWATLLLLCIRAQKQNIAITIRESICGSCILFL